MVSRRRDRERKPARRDASREPRKRLLIVCEGAVTEPEYFRQFANWCRNPLVEIRIEAAAGVPRTLVEHAVELKNEAETKATRERDENLAYDEVWCAFDVDAHPKVSEARDMAKANGLHLAMSNPCFELWLYLHLHESPGMQHRHELQKRCRAEMPGEADKYFDFDKLISGYDRAFRRAERLATDATKAGESVRNPTTEVFLLTDSIDQNGQQRRRPTSTDEGRAKAQTAADAAIAQYELELVTAEKKE